MNNYTINDFDYDIPDSLIAAHPSKERDLSRLLYVPNNIKLQDLYFNQLAKLITPGDLLVFNDSKVIKARVYGTKLSGGKIELLIERVLDDNTIISHVKSNKTINLGLVILLPNDLQLEIIEILSGGLFKLKIVSTTSNVGIMASKFDWFSYLDQFGHVPLPPYIKREDEASDIKSYQTVYAKHEGSVAAPTAGLHFTQEILKMLQAKGVNLAYVTLHVGSGTFKPVSVTQISEHKMHSEWYSVTQETVDLIKKTHQNGGNVIAVGTTSLRTLETIAMNNFKQLNGETDIFITPGFKFKVVDKLITNFHLPKSTLLMLVSAFAGFDTIKHVYKHAIDNKYKFFSYGDAMLLERA